MHPLQSNVVLFARVPEIALEPPQDDMHQGLSCTPSLKRTCRYSLRLNFVRVRILIAGSLVSVRVSDFENFLNTVSILCYWAPWQTLSLAIYYETHATDILLHVRDVVKTILQF